LVALVVVAPTVMAQQKQPFTTMDALNVANLRVQAITADGRYVAATSATDRDRKNVDHMRFGDPTYISPSFADVLVIETESGEQRRLFDEIRKVNLRSDKPIASNSSLEWRPDGSGVVLMLREETWATTSRQMFLDLTEGPTIVQDSREPFLAWEAVRNYGSLAVPAVVDIRSRDVRELLPEGRYSGIQQSEDGQFLTYIETTPLETSYSRGGGSQLAVQVFDLTTDSVRAVRDSVTRRINLNWNDAGNRFAYAERGNVFVQSIHDTAATNLTEEYRTPVSEDDSTKLSYSVMRWRPDGDRLLVRSQQGYHLLEPDSKEMDLVYELSEDDEEAPTLNVVNWSQDGQQLYMTYSAKDHWERGMVRYDLTSQQTTDLVKDSNLYTRWQFTEDGQKVFYNFSNGDLPNDLYMADAAFRNTTRLTDLNPWLADRTLTRSELIEYLDVDGEKLYGILYYPVDYEPGKKYPLVAEIYERFFNNGFNVNMNLLTNAGFFALRPSVNLEIGYPGEAWLKGVTAAVNTLITRGIVDEERLGVHGTSYGGYATNLLITQTDRFAAAINISGKVNIISFLGDSPKITTRNYNAAEEGQDRIGATLWEQPQKYLEHTAIMDADRITTPLLMLTGEGDWNVPATNQREMYYALRRLEKEVVWVHYMNAGHGAGRSSTVEDFHDHWNRIIEWYNEHFFKDDEEKVTTDISSGGR
jgi:dipeptidyl aminopeptidase/acylaminoacyl peptidase